MDNHKNSCSFSYVERHLCQLGRIWVLFLWSSHLQKWVESRMERKFFLPKTCLGTFPEIIFTITRCIFCFFYSGMNIFGWYPLNMDFQPKNCVLITKEEIWLSSLYIILLSIWMVIYIKPNRSKDTWEYREDIFSLSLEASDICSLNCLYLATRLYNTPLYIFLY